MTGKLVIPAEVAAKFAMPPVGTLTLEDAQGKSTYDPQPDIMAYEVALITRLFFRMTLGGPMGATPDWRAFLEEHRIMRHFQPA